MSPPEGGSEATAPGGEAPSDDVSAAGEDAGGAAEPDDVGEPLTAEPDADGPSPACSSDAECDDGQPCNGVETCTPFAGCMPGYAPNCDDGRFCNGTETCHPTAAATQVSLPEPSASHTGEPT